MGDLHIRVDKLILYISFSLTYAYKLVKDVNPSFQTHNPYELICYRSIIMLYFYNKTMIKLLLPTLTQDTLPIFLLRFDQGYMILVLIKFFRGFLFHISRWL